jgi:two-component system chemotaxis sensor kinase CheA
MDALAEIRNIYFDECDEFVGLLEGYLAAMGEGRATDEDIHGAFRAVHSIKGGAGAFALTELVEFSHLFEACLDSLRSGRMSITDAPVDFASPTRSRQQRRSCAIEPGAAETSAR